MLFGNRRLKKDVLSELPDKVRQMVLLDPRSIKVDKDLKNASKIIGSAKLKVRIHLFNLTTEGQMKGVIILCKIKGDFLIKMIYHSQKES